MLARVGTAVAAVAALATVGHCDEASEADIFDLESLSLVNDKLHCAYESCYFSVKVCVDPVIETETCRCQSEELAKFERSGTIATYNFDTSSVLSCNGDASDSDNDYRFGVKWIVENVNQTESNPNLMAYAQYVFGHLSDQIDKKVEYLSNYNYQGFVLGLTFTASRACNQPDFKVDSTGGKCVPQCTLMCDHGGVCTAPNTCNCTGTGYLPPTCSEPVHPCADNNGGCDPHAQCAVQKDNTVDCTCDQGWTGNGTSCTPICTVACMHGGSCIAPDMCNCNNTGYIPPICNSTSGGCDVNNGNCSAHATCTPIDYGANRTCTCDMGYYGNGFECDPYVTCNSSVKCFPHSHCEEILPFPNMTHNCTCDKGYALPGAEAKSCDPIDNCELPSKGNCPSDSVCMSTGPGTNICSCKSDSSNIQPSGTCSPETSKYIVLIVSITAAVIIVAIIIVAVVSIVSCRERRAFYRASRLEKRLLREAIIINRRDGGYDSISSQAGDDGEEANFTFFKD